MEREQPEKHNHGAVKYNSSPPQENPDASTSRKYPSWWRPDLALSTSIPNQKTEAYLSNKAAGKRIAAPDRRDGQNHFDSKHSSSRAPASRRNGPGARRQNLNSREFVQRTSRRYENNPLEREHISKTLSSKKIPPAGGSSSKAPLGRRKRRFVDSFLLERSTDFSSNEIVDSPRRIRPYSNPVENIAIISNLLSDSQVTLSDPNLDAYKAKQASQVIIFPINSRERPFKLNL